MARGAHEVPSTSKSDLQTFSGRFLVPIYSEINPETGRQLYGLGPREFHLVTHGLACPECLADFAGMWRPKCPCCGHDIDVSVDVKPEPDYWKPDPNDPDRRAT